MKKLTYLLLGAQLCLTLLSSIHAMDVPQDNLPLYLRALITQEALLEELVSQLEKIFPQKNIPTQDNVSQAQPETALPENSLEKESIARKRVLRIKRARFNLKRLLQSNDSKYTPELVLTTTFGALNSSDPDLKAPDEASILVIERYLEALKNDEITATTVARELLLLQEKEVARITQIHHEEVDKKTKSILKSVTNLQNQSNLVEKIHVSDSSNAGHDDEDTQSECSIQ